MVKITYRNVRNKIKFTINDKMGSLMGPKLQFMTIEQLIAWSREWSKELPQYDAVIGIPRSGLIPAMTIAEERRIPFSTPELFNDQDPSGGKHERD